MIISIELSENLEEVTAISKEFTDEAGEPCHFNARLDDPYGDPKLIHSIFDELHKDTDTYYNVKGDKIAQIFGLEPPTAPEE